MRKSGHDHNEIVKKDEKQQQIRKKGETRGRWFIRRRCINCTDYMASNYMIYERRTEQ